MPTHAEKRELPYSPEQLFELVAAIERYPEFIPWCRAVRVIRRDSDSITADVVVGFKVFRERFTCVVTLAPPSAVDVAYLKGPLRYLNNHWRFIANPQGGCTLDFYVDFEFHSALMQRVIKLLFNEAVRRMVSAFETRARALYVPGVKNKTPVPR